MGEAVETLWDAFDLQEPEFNAARAELKRAIAAFTNKVRHDVVK
jgi:hypothetical protein